MDAQQINPLAGAFLWMAESEGFEPPDPFGSTVFKTAAFGRSATSPRCHLASGPVVPKCILNKNTGSTASDQWKPLEVRQNSSMLPNRRIRQ